MNGVQVRQGEAEEFMLVSPYLLAGCVFSHVGWRRRGIGDLSDQVGSGGLGDAVYEDSDKRYSNEHVES